MASGDTIGDGVVGGGCPCGSCGYDLAGLPVLGACPECAREIAKSVPPCPRCREAGIGRPLKLITAENRRAWGCWACGGVAFERGQLAAEVREGGPAKRGLAAATKAGLTSGAPVACGGCGIPMIAMMVDGRIAIDRCDRCGLIWLDAGEFAAVASYLAGEIGTKRMPDDAEHLLGDRGALLRRLDPGGTDGAGSLTFEAILTALCILGW